MHSGDLLRDLRGARRLKQSEVAERLGVTDVAVSGWEARGVPASRLPALKDALGLSPYEYERLRDLVVPPYEEAS